MTPQTRETPTLRLVSFDVTRAYRQHARFIANVIQGLTGPGGHVDELLQETFIVAHRKRERYDGEAAVTSWLYGIAANLCRHHNRSRRRFQLFHRRFATQPELHVVLTPEQQVSDDERRARVYRALTGLSHEQREVFVLFELEEKSGDEIAALLSVPIGTVWSRLSVARSRFERQLRREAVREVSR